MTTLGRLEQIRDLREVWPREANDFTPWLAREENIKLLGDTIGLELEVEGQEEGVGPYRADILCRDTANNSWVLIENQLEKTDHCHMGQLITYAAGLEAVTIVWIAQKFTEEHRAALDWLNEKTDEDVNFFGLEIELWKISNSPMAPKFNIISKPNDWSRVVKTTAAKTELSKTEHTLYEYWSGLIEFMQKRDTKLRLPKPAAQHWLIFSVGKSYFQIFTRASNRGRQVGAYLCISGPHRLPYFDMMESRYNTQAEQAIGMELDWRRLPDKKESHIELYHDCDPSNQSDWVNQFEWLNNAVEKLHSFFSPIVRRLDLSELEEMEQEDASLK